MNCLVTKLNASVNNDSIEKFGVIEMTLAPNSDFGDYGVLTIQTGENTSSRPGSVISVKRGHIYSDKYLTNEISELAPTQEHQTLIVYYSNSDDVVVTISNKYYGIERIFNYPANVSNVNKARATGRLSDFFDTVCMYDFYFWIRFNHEPLEPLIENLAPYWDSDRTTNPYQFHATSVYRPWLTFNGSESWNNLYAIKSSGVVSIYSDTELSTLVATYNISSKVWNYT